MTRFLAAVAVSCTACLAPHLDGSMEVMVVNTDAGLDAGAPSDAGLPDAGVRRSSCPAVDGSGACRPLEPNDLVPLVSTGVNMPGGLVWLPDGGALLAVAHYDGPTVLVGDGRDPASIVSLTPRFGRSTDVTSAGDALYFVGVLPTGAPGLLRAEHGAAPEPVTLTGATTVPYWPQTIQLPDGRVLLAYVESQKRVFFGVSDATKRTFTITEPPVTPGVLKGVLAHVGVTRRGQWVLTHQVADANFFETSFVQRSSDDGRTWSPPLDLQPASDNVHDAFVVTRLDEGADLYYLHAGTTGDLNVFRRALREDGTLGPEQAVTSAAVGHVEKPQPRRLPDGRLLMLFAIGVSQSRYDVAMAVLDGDAPLLP